MSKPSTNRPLFLAIASCWALTGCAGFWGKAPTPQVLPPQCPPSASAEVPNTPKYPASAAIVAPITEAEKSATAKHLEFLGALRDDDVEKTSRMRETREWCLSISRPR